MGTQYNGLAGNITVPTVLTISSMSGSGVNPTVINFSTPHGLTTGDTIDVFNVDGNTAANGQNRVTVTGGSQVTIPVTGNGTYTALLPGQAYPQTFGSTYQIPSDGDLVSASNNNVSLESLGDRTAFLVTATGGYKLAALYTQTLSDSAYPTGATPEWTMTVTGGTLNTWVTANQNIIVLNGLHTTDVLDVSVSGAWSVQTGGGIGNLQEGYISLAYKSYAPGATPPASVTRLPGSAQYVNTVGASSATAYMPLSVSGVLNGVANSGFLELWFQGASAITGNVIVYKESTVTVRVWRPTGANQ